MTLHHSKRNVAQSKTLVVFDFDGTLTKIDTFNDFFCWTFGHWSFWSFIIRHGFEYIGALFGLVSAKHNKQVLAQYYLGGMSPTEFGRLAQWYARQRLPDILRTDIVELIKIHQVAGDSVILASASVRDWVEAWAENVGISTVIASELAQENGELTGKFTKHTFGPEKLVALKKTTNLKDYNTIHVYTDSEADRPLLNIATHQHRV